MDKARARSNSKGKKKEELSWDSYIQLIYALAEKIKESKIKFDYIYGPCRGGYIPAVILSHELNVPILDPYDNFLAKKTILIIDDLIDTSKTIKESIEFIRYKFDRSITNIPIYTASIYKHKKSKYTPDFHVMETSCWVQFPYEKD